jgi:hypothetical protein
MDTRVFCVYNLARGAFLSSKVTVADTASEPLKMLKVLVGGLGLDTVSGLLLSPLYAAPAVPRLFPFDLLYLDSDNQVVDAEEILPGVEFPPFRPNVASALLLARHTLQSTQTVRGDRLLIGCKEEIEQEIADGKTHAAEPVTQNGKSFGGKLPASVQAKRREVAWAEPERSLIAAQVSSAVTGVSENAVAATAVESAEAETPVISITEVVLERSHGQQAPTISGQHGGVEDLFANWVDTPSVAAGWIPRDGAPQARKTNPPQPAPALQLSPVPERATEPNPSAAVVTQNVVEAAKTEQQSVVGVPVAADQGLARPGAPRELPEVHKDSGATAQSETRKKGTVLKQNPAQANSWSAVTVPAVNTDSTRIAPPLATTFTVAQYGMWQASKPTALKSLTGSQGSVAERSAASAAQSSKAAEPQKLDDDLRVSAKVPLSSSISKPAREKFPKPPLPTTGQASTTAAADLRPLVNVLKSAVEQLPDRVTGAAGQPQAAKTTVTIPAETERPNALGDDAAIAEILEAARKIKPAEATVFVEPKPIEPVQTAPAKQAVDKKKADSTAHVSGSLNQPSHGIEKAEQANTKISTQPAVTNGKAKEQPLSLGMRFKRWLNPVAPTNSDRRKAYRRYVPGMVAHYYTGGAPKPHDVADISMTGIYLLTDDRWMPETMIQMTLQKPCAKGERKQSITVLAKIVRRGSDGVAAQFVTPETLDRNSHDVQPTQTTDRFALARFI